MYKKVRMRKKDRARLTVRAACILALTLLSPMARPFHLDTHGAITYAGLSASSLASAVPGSGSSWEFADQTRLSIATFDAAVDGWTLAGTFRNSGPDHFDDSLLHEGADRLIKHRQGILQKLTQAEKLMNGSSSSILSTVQFNLRIFEARVLLGTALHGVQDFYAHSNWANSGANTVAPMVWADANAIKTNPWPLSIQSHCDVCGTVPDRGLGTFSGTFRFPSDRMSAEVLTNKGICIHGPGTPLVVTGPPPVLIPQPQGCPQTLKGLAKDDEGNTPEEKSLHETAYNLAIAATAAYTQGILLEAREQGLYVALCAFLGYADARKCLAGQIAEKEFEFPFETFASGSYKTSEIFTWDVPKFDSSQGQLRSISTRWEWSIDGDASCPANPSSVIGGANACLAIRRIAGLAVTSPDLNVGPLYCNTSADLQTSTCGLNGTMPDDFGFSYIVWPGGAHHIKYDADDFPPKQIRNVSTNYGPLVAAGPGQTFRMDGSFTSRLLFNLGIDNGGTREPSTYLGSGAYLSFTGKMKIHIKITYEYVPKQE